MNSNTSTQPKRKQLLDIIAERLGCACLSDLRMPQYRERALKELQEGDFDHLEERVQGCRPLSCTTAENYALRHNGGQKTV